MILDFHKVIAKAFAMTTKIIENNINYRNSYNLQ